ncbi:MAG TPA: Eco57I restriction-modification methylase domain-containing protein, partial [Blastocatellia bacterium]
MPDKNDERHRYGQHYTPEIVGRLIAAFAIRSSGDLAFDPSCGDGRLLKCAIAMKHAIASAETTAHTADRANLAEYEREHGPLCKQVFGIDRSADAIRSAAPTGAHLAQIDFFEIQPGSPSSQPIALPAGFDAIVGNPPYIRQELMESSQKQSIFNKLNGSVSPSGRARGRAKRRSDDGSECLFDLVKGSEDSRESGISIPEWSGRSDIYVYFFFQAARFLKPGGRLVFITSSSWLDVGYGSPLREFLLKNFRIIAILESAVESFFDQASINTTITVLERETRAAVRDTNKVRFVQLRAPLGDVLAEYREPKGSPAATLILSTADQSLEPRSYCRELQAVKFAKRIESAEQADSGTALGLRIAEQRSLLFEMTEANKTGYRPQPSNVSKWGKYLRADEIFFRIIERGARLKPLSEMAGVRFGVKTGANDFFYVKQAITSEGRTTDGDLVPLNSVASVRRGITTGANEFFYLKAVETPDRAASRHQVLVEDGAGRQHLVESSYLRPVIFSLKEIRQIHLETWTPSRFLFCCLEDRDSLQGTSALEYIEQGESSGYHLRRSCSARRPWYALARDLKPAELIFPSKVGERWIIAINAAGVYEDKKL